MREGEREAGRNLLGVNANKQTSKAAPVGLPDSEGDPPQDLETINGLTEVQVIAYDDPEKVRELGAEGVRVRSRVGAFTCYGNALVLARLVARRDPARGVAVVGGFAMRHLDEGGWCVQAHAWVRIGAVHFDCTWSLWGLPLNRHRYFQAFEETAFGATAEHDLMTRISGVGKRLGVHLE